MPFNHKLFFTWAIACLSQTGIAQTHPYPLRLWYNEPASTWEGSLPLGNGRLGMTPDGGVTTENIVLNDITLWSGSQQDANNYQAYKSLPEIRRLLFEGKNDQAQQLVDKNFICVGPGSGGPRWGCFQMLGTLKLDFTYGGSPANPTNYRRTLSLDSAIATTSYEVNNIKYKKEYFTSFSTDVDIIRISADKPGSISCAITIDRPEKRTISTGNSTLQMEGQLDNGVDGKGMRYLAKVQAVLKGGSQRTEDNKLIIRGATELILYISAGTDFNNPDFVNNTTRILTKAIGQPYPTEKKSHITTYQRLFNRVTLNLGPKTREDLPTNQRLIAFQKAPDEDNGMAALFYQFGRYLSISSTRVGLLPPNLQGLWANQIHTPWNGDYHLDVNVEMNHWPVDVSNLSELDLPLARLVEEMVPNGKKTAKAYYQADGWVAHVITNPWHFTEPGESASWGAAKSGSGWLCNNLWQYYEFTNDTAYLRRIYPVLKGAAQFYKDMLIRDPKSGWLVTSPSSSPENSFILPNGNHASICMGPTIDNQITRELFNNTITASELFHIDKAFRDTLQSQLPQLPPPGRIAPDGRMMEWLDNYPETEPHHRHISHLYGLYPGSLITPDNTPDLAEACKKTLDARGDDGPSWSIAYKMLMWSRLYDGNRAYRLFKYLLRPTFATNINYGSGGGIYPNLFSAAPPFQIDANFGGEAGLAEMLIQSHAGYINLLPAIPDEWRQEGEVKGLKARGNYTVDFKWKDGKVISYQIHSKQPRTLKIKLNGEVRTISSTTRSTPPMGHDPARSATPPMGWMSWNSFGPNINETVIRSTADAMITSGMKQAGYTYIFIDDGWQGGRDSHNNLIPDPKKFPHGIKTLAAYVHSKGLKLGIYSDAAEKTCGGFTGSLGFEEQDAATFAAWGIDYLKYDYCNAPTDAATASARYRTMADALATSGREILLGICEWGERQPWLWAAAAGGTVWRTTGDIRDKWKAKPGEEGMGILNIVDINADLDQYAQKGHWNDPDMLVVGLHGKKGPASDLGGIGCNDLEYQSQFSLYCIMAAPLAASNDLRNLTVSTKSILTNKEAISIDQDPLGIQGKRKVNDDTWEIFTKPLANGDIAVAILNKADKPMQTNIRWSDLDPGLSNTDTYEVRDVWTHQTTTSRATWRQTVAPHETRLLKLLTKTVKYTIYLH